MAILVRRNKMARPSGTQERAERSPIHLNPSDKIFTCEIDMLRRTSAIPGARPKQKCIVILID